MHNSICGYSSWCHGTVCSTVNKTKSHRRLFIFLKQGFQVEMMPVPQTQYEYHYYLYAFYHLVLLTVTFGSTYGLVTNRSTCIYRWFSVANVNYFNLVGLVEVNGTSMQMLWLVTNLT